jgi:hypothetical protein
MSKSHVDVADVAVVDTFSNQLLSDTLDLTFSASNTQAVEPVMVPVVIQTPMRSATKTRHRKASTQGNLLLSPINKHSIRMNAPASISDFSLVKSPLPSRAEGECETIAPTPTKKRMASMGGLGSPNGTMARSSPALQMR